MLPAGRFRCDEDGRALRSTPPNGNGYADAANGAAVEAAVAESAEVFTAMCAVAAGESGG
jgi:hypothetical protein